MANDIDLPSDLHKLAKTYLLAKSAFNRAYCGWSHMLPPCSDEVGWRLLDAFRSEVKYFVFDLKRAEGGTGDASWEVFRKTLTDESDYHFADAAGFVKWYKALTNKIARGIGHLYDYHGDTFGDLADSYPLAGRELVERALASDPKSTRPRREGYLDEDEVTSAVREKHGDPWYKLICRGENYVARKLEVASYNCYLHRILTGRGECVSWTPDEQSAVEFANHYDE